MPILRAAKIKGSNSNPKVVSYHMTNTGEIRRALGQHIPSTTPYSNPATSNKLLFTAM